MKRIFIFIFLIFILTGILFAGLFNTSPTYVSVNSNGSGYAYGVLSHTQESNDTKQFIKCEVVSNTTNGDYLYTMCFAKDEEGDYISGYSYNERVAKVVAAISKDSWVGFSVNYIGEIFILEVNNRSVDVR